MAEYVRVSNDAHGFAHLDEKAWVGTHGTWGTLCGVDPDELLTQEQAGDKPVCGACKDIAEGLAK